MGAKAFLSVKPRTTKGIPSHLSWLVDDGEILKTVEGVPVKVLKLHHKNDDAVLSLWAKHFRNQYCLDSEIDLLRKGPALSRSEYLNTRKFPDNRGLGPSIRSGDFGEILVADYLEFSLDYWVPRTRYNRKTIKNESTKGSDILGFKFVDENGESPDDILAIFESKSLFTKSKNKTRLQDAVDGSIKDFVRKAESLNAIKQRYLDKGLLDEVSKIERFESPADKPYKEVYGAVALFSTDIFDDQQIKDTSVNKHPNKDQLILLVIKGINMMELVHELYRRASDEA